jgi:hypothetical protein
MDGNLSVWKHGTGEGNQMVGKIERLQLNVPFKDDETRHECVQQTQ